MAKDERPDAEKLDETLPDRFCPAAKFQRAAAAIEHLERKADKQEGSLRRHSLGACQRQGVSVQRLSLSELATFL